MNSIELYTKRLDILTLNISGASLVADYHLTNRDFLKKWSPVRDDVFFTTLFQSERLKENPTGETIRFYLFHAKLHDKVIGEIVFSNIVQGAFQSCNLGYNCLESEINKGIVSEALSKTVGYVFSKYRLHRIEANVMPRNEPSIRVLNKLGFENEGLRKKYLNINGIWEDHFSFVLWNDVI